MKRLLFLYLSISFIFIHQNKAEALNAYVTSSSGVIVIDATTRTPTATITVGTDPYGIGITPDNAKLYVANNGSSNVSVIDVATSTVIATIPVSADPTKITVSPDGSQVYVSHGIGSSEPINVIDVSTDSVIATISVGAGAFPTATAFTPDGTKVYASLLVGGLVIINPGTFAVTGSIPLGGFGSLDVAISPDGTKAYRTVLFTGIDVIDVPTDTFSTVIPAGTTGQDSVEFTSDGIKAYMTDTAPILAPGVVFVIDVSTDTATPITVSGGGCEGLGITPGNAEVWVASNLLAIDVVIIDTASDTEIATIGLGVSGVFDIAFAQPETLAISGQCCSNMFFSQEDSFVTLTWTTDDVNISEFRVYRDGVLIATLPSTARSYKDSNRDSNIPYVYEVIAVDSNGIELAVGTVTVTCH